MNPTPYTLYTDSPSAWKAMLLACEKATYSIDLEQFIFVLDEVGNRFIELFERKVKEGVKVRILCDAAGSFKSFGSSIKENIKSKGIQFVFWKTLLPRFVTIHNFRSWYFRNHRRTLVIDGKIGFTGSVSMATLVEDWRETHIRLEGQVVEEMQTSFERMWEQAHKEKVPRLRRKVTNLDEWRYVINTPLPQNRYLYREILAQVKRAEQLIFITTPYLVPTARLVQLLRRAAKRNVDVRLMITESSDHPIVDLAARTYFHTLLKAGIKIYLYTKKVLHSKTIVIDNTWAGVGTINMDHISLLYNYEANIVSTHKPFVEQISSHFKEDIHGSKEITLEEWRKGYLFEKIMGIIIRTFRIFL